MTLNAIALRHVHFEDLGVLEPLLQARGYTVRYVDAAVEDLPVADALAADLLVVLGGPIGAFDEPRYPFLARELELVRARLANRAPTLGICLGAQLIARALDANVYPMAAGPEIGFGALTLTDQGQRSALAGLRDTPVLHWHGDQFDIPAGAIRLAGTAAGPNQAFEYGNSVLGLQFHLEADLRNFEHWLVGHACELARAGIDPATLRARAPAVQAGLRGAARAVFNDWLDRIVCSNTES
ncbi:glutamine amidotransferase [Achromobacter xylosoxidans]|uniref:glutamine amidotransferase n=1 Tax=Alcaligenes xylosoxydans xylosoxydans TaxID=85698 RepID=UPI0006C6A2FC|nr:glutamine amidotransferase [Achromobacter xylosoxidans]CUI46255.1 glutamine amidotransferase [Achromobacter xylosoxidans]